MGLASRKARVVLLNEMGDKLRLSKWAIGRAAALKTRFEILGDTHLRGRVFLIANGLSTTWADTVSRLQEETVISRFEMDDKGDGDIKHPRALQVKKYMWEIVRPRLERLEAEWRGGETPASKGHPSLRDDVYESFLGWNQGVLPAALARSSYSERDQTRQLVHCMRLGRGPDAVPWVDSTWAALSPELRENRFSKSRDDQDVDTAIATCGAWRNATNRASRRDVPCSGLDQARSEAASTSRADGVGPPK